MPQCPTVFFIVNLFLFVSVSAGKATTDEELEEMLESGNAAVFTAGVCMPVHTVGFNCTLHSLCFATNHNFDSDALRWYVCVSLFTCFVW